MHKLLLLEGRWMLCVCCPVKLLSPDAENGDRGRGRGRVSVMKLKKAYLLYVLSIVSLVGELQS